MNDAKARGTSGWVVWIAVAALGMILLGTFHIALGTTALLQGETSSLRGAAPTLDVSPTVWGCIHLGVGALIGVAGFLVFAGQRWARGVGVTVAMLSALASVAFAPAGHPVWTVLVVIVAVIVILALTVHGSEIRAGE